MTALELALIPAGAALSGVVLGTAGNAFLDRSRERRAAKRDQERAAAELLTATVDLITGIQATHSAYQQRMPWRHHVLTAATVLVAIGSTMTNGESLSWELLRDWHRMGQGIERLLTADRELGNRQRTAALDLATVVGPRLVRFYAAVTVLTLGPNKKIADSARQLAAAVGALLEVVATKEKKFTPAREHVEKALESFRDVVDQRRR